jgi:flagellar hook-associated protein 3 FlgL
MRVTDQMLFELASRYGGEARSRLERATAQTASGLRVSHPGDDPAAAGLLVGSRIAQVRLEAIASAAGRASDELAVADSALDGVSNAVVRARELAVQLVNPTYAPAQRAQAAGEVDGLLQQVVAQMNSRVGDRYVFGGNRDGSAPFDASGAYLGDTGVRQVEIAPGVLSAASVRADVALKGVDPTSGTGTVTGADVPATLRALAAALRANDLAGVRATLDGLDRGLTQVSAARASVGDAQGAMDTAVTASKAARDDERARASKLGDVDIVESATELSLAQRALEASLSATAQGFRLTLLDYLK